MTLANLSLWLCTYLLHSSVLLIACCVIDRFGLLKQLRLAEWSWRVALLAGILSASLQYSHLVQRESPVTLPPTKSGPMNVEAGNKISIPSSTSSEHQTSSISAPSTLTSSSMPAKVLPSSLAHNYPLMPTRVDLPSHITRWLEWFAALWLVYAVWCALSVLIQIGLLNRQINKLPSANEYPQEFNLHFVLQSLKLSPSRVRLNHAWHSPFLAPNKLLCIPFQALRELPREQLHAIIAHEVRHLQRQDPIWRIATHLISRIFFFQVLNQMAQRKLNLLAEFDCDYFANQSVEARTDFGETLLWCVENSAQTTLPSIAVTMAAPSALAQRINLLLDDGAIDSLFKKPNFWSNVGLLFALAGSIFMLASLPRFAHAIPALTAAKENTIKTEPKLSSTSEIAHVNTMDEKPNATRDETRKYNRDFRDDDIEIPPPNFKVSVQDLKLDSIEIPSHTASNETPSDIEKKSGGIAAQISTNNEGAKSTNAASDISDIGKPSPEWSELVRRANAGDQQAQLEVGERFWYGEGVKADHRISKTWFEKSAAQGNPRAQAFIRMMHDRESRMSEIEFFTQHFDGQDLKWSEDRCPLPTIDLADQKQNDYPQLIKAIDKSVECRNNYLAELKKQMAGGTIIPTALQNLMTSNELDQANQLIHKVLVRNALVSREKAVAAVDSVREWERKFVTPGSLSSLNPRLTGYYREPEQKGYQVGVVLQPSDLQRNQNNSAGSVTVPNTTPTNPQK